MAEIRAFRRALGVALGGLVAIPVILVGSAGPAQAAPNCGAVVTASTTVTANLVDCPGDGLVIGAHNIVLNLNGRTIDGVGLGVGVHNNGFDRVTIRNGTITGFDYGVRLNPGTLGNLVTAITARHNEVAGVELVNADTNNRVIGNVLEFQSQRGIAVLGGSTGNIVRGNTVRENRDGIYVENSASNTVETNQVIDSSDRGIEVVGSQRVTLRSNTLTGSGDAALALSGSISTPSTATPSPAVATPEFCSAPHTTTRCSTTGSRAAATPGSCSTSRTATPYGRTT